MSIEAMKQALEALKEPWKAGPDGVADAIIALEKALAKQEQGEPVAWITPDGEGFRIRFSPPVNNVPLGWDALYTTPQQRKPLTDDELYEIVRAEGKVLKAHAWEIVQNLQAKLKEKNT
jgi:hypothetical protein